MGFSKVSSSSKTDIYYIEVLGKTLNILDVFAQAKKATLSLQEISVASELNKNTVFRILYTLANHEYITKENHLYRLGPKVANLGNSQRYEQGLVTTVGPYLTALRDTFGETANLGILNRGSVCYIDVRESTNPFRLAERVGGIDPLHSTALGKAQLAFLPQEEVRLLMKECRMKKYTPHTVTSVGALLAELKQIRDQGYAIDNQESVLGAFCVAVPILNSLQYPVAAISIAGPLIRFNESQLPKVSSALCKAASEIQSRIQD